MSDIEWSLRAARDEDATAVATVWHEAWHDAHAAHVPPALLPHRTREHFAARVPPRIGHSAVGVADGEVLGFMTVRDDELELLFVRARARGIGLAPFPTKPRSPVHACRSRAVATSAPCST